MQSLLVPARSPEAKSAMVAWGAKPRSTSSSSRMPQVSASRCSSGLSKKQKVEAASTPTKTGSAASKISSRRPMRMVERSYCSLILRA